MYISALYPAMPLLFVLDSVYGLLMTQYNMDQLCGSDVKLRQDQLIGLISINTSRNRSWSFIQQSFPSVVPTSCWLSISAPGADDHIALAVTRVSRLGHEDSCTRIHLCSSVAVCHYAPYDLINVCDSGTNDVGHHSIGNRLLLYYHSMTPVSFTMMFNVIHIDLRCRTDEVKCKTSGWCVNTSLTCLGYNVCGDDTPLCSDVAGSSETPTTMTAILVVTITLLFLIIIGIALFCCLSKYRVCRREDAHTDRTPSVLFAEALRRGVENRGLELDFQEINPAALAPPPAYSSLENISTLDLPPPYETVIANQDAYKTTSQ